MPMTHTFHRNSESFPVSLSKLETRLAVVQAESLSTVVRDPVSNRFYFNTHACAFLPEPFEDEIHPRLRYTHRGLVAMANNGTKNSNDSQFFITLGMFSASYSSYSGLTGVALIQDRADELHGKHTLFGRVVGDTLYSTSSNNHCS